MRITPMCGGPSAPRSWSDIKRYWKLRAAPKGDWGREYTERGVIFDLFDIALIWRAR